ncbi:lytic transglycosylase domain-containing protein [Actinomadura sp. J1-007]|uniref:lytic transglycosylase domain-containing protein n=1 Tax=Actinomadura sp. J1-007 TaxID=2661913 RepID=UPI00132A5AA1|nr:lytic transglycosylase domain-containing protein [Actinomadura sp. J1-007]MWK33933.1 lytic transglycosylase domain-containing protein [Actinomadura sp. J1-007]
MSFPRSATALRRNAPVRRSATLALAAALSFGVVAETVPAQAAAPTRAAVAQTAAAQTAVTAKAKKKPTRAQRNKALAKPMVKKRGWSTRQYGCLVKLWNRESHWNHKAHNRSSGAYGIPQALPGRKMRSAGKDWKSNPARRSSGGSATSRAATRRPAAP